MRMEYIGKKESLGIVGNFTEEKNSSEIQLTNRLDNKGPLGTL